MINNIRIYDKKKFGKIRRIPPSNFVILNAKGADMKVRFIFILSF